MLGDGKPDQAWQAALKHDGHLIELMLGVRYIPDANLRAPALRAGLNPARDRRDDAATRTAALDALGWARPTRPRSSCWRER